MAEILLEAVTEPTTPATPADVPLWGPGGTALEVGWPTSGADAAVEDEDDFDDEDEVFGDDDEFEEGEDFEDEDEDFLEDEEEEVEGEAETDDEDEEEDEDEEF
jgi:hypothetical protein